MDLIERMSSKLLCQRLQHCPPALLMAYCSTINVVAVKNKKNTGPTQHVNYASLNCTTSHIKRHRTFTSADCQTFVQKQYCWTAAVSSETDYRSPPNLSCCREWYRNRWNCVNRHFGSLQVRLLLRVHWSCIATRLEQSRSRSSVDEPVTSLCPSFFILKTGTKNVHRPNTSRWKEQE